MLPLGCVQNYVSWECDCTSQQDGEDEKRKRGEEEKRKAHNIANMTCGAHNVCSVWLQHHSNNMAWVRCMAVHRVAMHCVAAPHTSHLVIDTSSKH